MSEQVFPTKGNLIKTKRSLLQAQLGYDLMDRKRSVLVREMVSLVDAARELRDEIDVTYAEAYRALEYANMTLGIVGTIAQTFPVENSLKLASRSVMSVELPKITANLTTAERPPYSMTLTSSEFDKAYIKFNKVKEITVRLAELENSIYRLAVAIKKTQKRANALKNIIIPRFEEQLKYISNALEEKDREEFSRQKVIKHRKYNS
ncbi:MAG: V-type ATP synthase subunit D [Oscillospiraceae bacterium]|nr:V-type ATP synthase subunit D [Oscillospiraceae bacterium]